MFSSDLSMLPPSCTVLPSSHNRSSRLVEQQIRAVTRPSLPRHNLCRLFLASQMGRTTSLPTKVSSSAFLVAKFDLQHRLAGHSKGVNSVHFGRFGGQVVVVSASDDLQVILWDLETKRKILGLKTDHEILVTQAKLVEGGGEGELVTSCYDGQVRLTNLSRDKVSRVLVQHRGSIQKLALVPHSAGLVLSAGEDGQVFLLDPRAHQPIKLLALENRRGLKVPIYSLQVNPANCFQFCQSGRDQYLRLFDMRRMSRPQASLSPSHLPDGVETRPNMAVFSRSGNFVIISYDFLRHTDKNIYLFTSSGPDTATPQHVYRGYRDSPVLAFYGENDEFVVSGSIVAYAGLNSGDILFWDRESEGVSRVVSGDRHGIVRGLESHPAPSVPLIASCGLDIRVKLWGPEVVQ